MTAEQQQGGTHRQRVFDCEAPSMAPCHDPDGEDGIRSVRPEERRAATASDQGRALTENLMEEATDRGNLNRAHRRVQANKGAPGVDGMTVGDLKAWIADHKAEPIASLEDGTYRPQPVRGVEIPKPGGGMRQSGSATVVDRLVQQAIRQVLERLLAPTSSSSSFGFRADRGARQAPAQAGRSVAGVCGDRHEGTPQEGPLSPLLANLLLDDLDRELERRGHAFCRYADDCNIHVQSRAAGERVLASSVRSPVATGA
jgi:RNA-directed DNA polymerase